MKQLTRKKSSQFSNRDAITDKYRSKQLIHFTSKIRSKCTHIFNIHIYVFMNSYSQSNIYLQERQRKYHPCRRLWRLIVYSLATTSSFLALLPFSTIFTAAVTLNFFFPALRAAARETLIALKEYIQLVLRNW